MPTKTNNSKFSSYFGAAILPGSPTNSAVPTITGTARVGQTLTGANGTWGGSPIFTRRWYANGIAIDGATGATYVPVAGDLGKTITLQVMGTNASGTRIVSSAATAAVIAA